MMMTLAERIDAEGISLKWGAEIRLEKYWSREKCEVLARSGCVLVSVGYESGVQRVLDLIDKGTSPEQVERVVSELHRAGISVEMMGFTGFPSETRVEAFESIDFLARNRHLWSFGGMGNFSLTAGSIVARNPEQFGISNVAPRKGDDILRNLEFDDDTRSAEDELEIRRRSVQLRTWDFDRPWAGGIDTPHTFFYVDRYGLEALQVLSKNPSFTIHDEVSAVGEVVTLPSSLAEAEGVATLWVGSDSKLYKFPREILSVLETLSRIPQTLLSACAQAGIRDDEVCVAILDRLLDAGLVHGCSGQREVDSTSW